MNSREIVTEYLVKNGHDGLYVPGDCGCRVDNLMPCDNIGNECEAGYLMPGNEEFDWLIGPKQTEPGGDVDMYAAVGSTGGYKP